MYTERTTIMNKSGLHARPASVFVKEAKAFASKVKIQNLKTPGEVPANAKSIISVLGLGMGQGTEVEISAEGPDEEKAVKALVALIESGFDE